MAKKCELYDRTCTGCNECSLCEFDDQKICDSCCKCISASLDEKFKTILIDGIIDERKTRLY